MTSRREFLKVGLTASALLPVGARASFGVETRAPVLFFYKVLYDTRFVASVAFARRAAHPSNRNMWRRLLGAWRATSVRGRGGAARTVMVVAEHMRWIDALAAAAPVSAPSSFQPRTRSSKSTCDALRSQTDGHQATEVAIAAQALNRMLDLGRPEYVRIA